MSYHNNAISVFAKEWLNNKYRTGCVHNWVFRGHGHNSSFYRCSKCGVEDDY